MLGRTYQRKRRDLASSTAKPLPVAGGKTSPPSKPKSSRKRPPPAQGAVPRLRRRPALRFIGFACEVYARTVGLYRHGPEPRGVLEADSPSLEPCVHSGGQNKVPVMCANRHMMLFGTRMLASTM